MSQETEIMCRVTCAHTREIFMKYHVKDPMNTVFNAPMAPHGRRKNMDISQARDIVTNFFGDFLSNPSLGGLPLDWWYRMQRKAFESWEN